MAIFFEKRSILSRIRKGEWGDEEELRGLLTQLSEHEVKAGDLVWMMLHNTALIRQFAAHFAATRRVSGLPIALVKEAVEETRNRPYLVKRITELRDPSVYEWVDKALVGKDGEEKNVAVDLALEAPQPYGGRYLMQILNSEDKENRLRAIEKLAAARQPGAPMDPRVRELYKKLAKDPYDRIRKVALEALGGDYSTESATFIVDAFLEETERIRRIIVPILENLAAIPELGIIERAVDLLSHGDDLVRRTMLQLALHHAEPKEVLRRILLSSQQLMGWMRERILRTIRESGDDVIPPLLELLRHPDENVRLSALLFAANFESPRLVKPAIELLNVKDWWTRLTAMDILGRLGGEEAVDPLIACLRDDEVRWSAIEALTRIGSPRALEHIVRLMGDSAKEVRMQVITALKVYNNERTLPVLMRAMAADSDLEVRERALEAYKAICAANQREVDDAELRKQFGYGETTKALDKLLKEVRRLGGSDLHIQADSPPTLRVHGKLVKSGARELPAAEAQEWLYGTLTPQQHDEFERTHQLDYCYVIPGVGRYRGNIYRERHGMGGVFRVIPNEVPTFQSTRLPEALRDIVNYSNGLVIVTGKTNSGKSTTLAALVNLFNDCKDHHILTIEDPIETVHSYKRSLVNQRQINKHTDSFSAALRAALREDPDVIVVGEMRDRDTMSLALTAAETGHVVIATMHAPEVHRAIDRLIDGFSIRERPQIRLMLSESLRVVIGQNLMPRADGQGRIAYHEVLMGTGPVRALIRDAKTQLIPSSMEIGRTQGQITTDMSLLDLLEQKLITPEEAYRRGKRKEKFEPYVTAEFLAGEAEESGTPPGPAGKDAKDPKAAAAAPPAAKGAVPAPAPAKGAVPAPAAKGAPAGASPRVTTGEMAAITKDGSPGRPPRP